MRFFSRRSSATPHAEEKWTTTAPRTANSGTILLERLSLSTMHLLALVFLILVEIGNISNKPVLRSIWFIRINLSNIVPESVPNAVLINSIAQTIGLHDFYQVGLWNFCEGYNNQGITSCSKTKTLYWFNPVEIIINELLSGATIALPANITSILSLVRLASHWMFACFLVATCLTFICIFLAPLGVSAQPHYLHRGRRTFGREIPLLILTFLTLLFTAVASVIATVMFVIFRNVFTGQTEVNIGAEIGKPMLAFMWIAVGFNLISFLWQLFTSFAICCCSGKRKARKQGLLDGAGNGVRDRNRNANGVSEKDAVMNRRFGRKSPRAQASNAICLVSLIG